MREYSPKRRTALVLTGSGTAGAYHAGALKAIDESGVKIDLVVGTGAGAVAAAFAAVAGGPRLYGKEGFWDGASGASFARLRSPFRAAVLMFGALLGVFLAPAALALVLGLLSPLLLGAWTVWSRLHPEAQLSLPSGVLATLPRAYVVALAVPGFGLALLAAGLAGRALLGDRRRLAESFEALCDPGRGARRLARDLWEVARGPTVHARPPSPTELSRRFVALLGENLGQPGFREMILRASDLDAGRSLDAFVLTDAHRSAFATARGRTGRSRAEGIPGAVDLRAPGYESLLFDFVATGLLPPFVAPVRRVYFPRGGIHAGEVHRIADALLSGGVGITEAVAAGAEQVIVVAGSPEEATAPPRRRGPRALGDAVLASLERQALEREAESVQTRNRMIETLGHRLEEGGRAWQDPATGCVHRDVALYVVRPDRRRLGPLELDGSRDPASEVLDTPADLMETGYRDAYRLFVEPVVGASPDLRPGLVEEEPRAVEL
jgi:hypothetical protein